MADGTCWRDERRRAPLSDDGSVEGVGVQSSGYTPARLSFSQSVCMRLTPAEYIVFAVAEMPAGDIRKVGGVFGGGNHLFEKSVARKRGLWEGP